MPKKPLLYLLVIVLTGMFFHPAIARQNNIKFRWRNSHFSDRKLIHSANYDFQNQDGLSKLSANQQIDTLKVLAIRVQFQKDSNIGTTGDGTFDLSATSNYSINLPPHDKVYFEHQLQALSNYYKSVSRGKLVIQGDVYPADSDGAYQLPQKMEYYSPNTTDEELDRRLAELFRDAWQLADQQDNIPFENYDSFIIFHAGVGADISFDLEITPNNIPSVFLSFSDLKNALGANDPNYAGISVTSYSIRDGLILPETQNQQGYDIGLLGTMTLQFGHQIGLPNLYDTETGHTGIGVFGMMDQGSGNFSGIMPAQPCAWSKVFLGWEEPIEVNEGANLDVASSLAENSSKIYKIPINAHEYYLIENRQRHIKRSENITIGYDHNGARLNFAEDGKINIPDNVDKMGVIVDIEEYDFGLPGSGILIWHIDENVIAENYASNRVNVDMNHRGVDLVEADGAQDIGHFYNFFGITGYESGSEWDMWWDENDAFIYANDSTRFGPNKSLVGFTPSSIPNSNTLSGARSNVSITDFSEIKPIMAFTLTRAAYQNGFPQPTGTAARALAPIVGDIDGVSGMEIVVPMANGTVLAWRADGSKVIVNNDSIAIPNVKGGEQLFPLAIFANGAESSVEGPALADLDGDGAAELTVAGSSIRAYSGSDQNNDERADLLFSYDTGMNVTTAPIVMQSLIVVGTASGEIVAIDYTGNRIWQTDLGNADIIGVARIGNNDLVTITTDGEIVRLDAQGNSSWTQHIMTDANINPPVVADLDGDDEQEIVISDQAGVISIFSADGTTEVSAAQTEISGDSIGRPALGDIDQNGTIEIVFTGNGRLWAFNYQAMPVHHFPIEFDRFHPELLKNEPLLANIDTDDELEIMVAYGTNVYGFDIDGKPLDGFPLSLGGNANTTPVLSDMDDDGKLNISVTADDGYMYSWDVAYTFSTDKMAWQRSHGDWLNSAMIAITGNEPMPQASSELMPEKTVYNWPNPNEDNYTFVHYWLNTSASVKIRIYDMAGDLMDELTGTSFAQADNSVRVDLSDLQSGVYIVRVEATNANDTNVAFFKMAVVK